MYWEEQILTHFFDFEGISILLPYFCKCNHEQCNDLKLDVISSTLIMFLTCPLQLIMDPFGISLFYNRSTFIYPYHLMTPQQKKVLLDLCFRNNEYNILNEHVVFKRSKENTTVPIAITLQVLCSKIFASKTYTDQSTQIAICNIIMQRIQGYIPISASVQKELNQWIQKIQNQEIIKECRVEEELKKG